jgi:hypothetical protein
MRPVIRSQSQLLYRKSYKPSRKPSRPITRPIRIRPVKRLDFTFCPVNRFGVKPKLIEAPQCSRTEPG